MAQRAAVEAAEDARQAEEEAVEKARDNIRSEADIGAERLEEESKAVRKATDRRAELVKGEIVK